MKTTSASIFVIYLCIGTLGCGTGGIGGGSGGDEIQYAALGASDAIGIGASPNTQGYVYLIEDDLANAGHSTNLMNYGIPTIETDEILHVELELLDEGHTPNLVTLFTGSNDVVSGVSASNFESNLSDVLEHLSKIEDARVFVADLPDLTKLPTFIEDPDSDVTAARVQEFNEIIHSQVAAWGAHLVLLSAEPPDATLVSDDGFHPNNAGYRRIADLFLQEIFPTLG